MTRVRFWFSAGLLLAFALVACGEREEIPAGDASSGKSSPGETPDPSDVSVPDAPENLAGLSQEQAGIEAVHAILTGELDSIAPRFEEEVRPDLTRERAKILRSQISWLYDLIGGEFEQFMSGRTRFPDSTPAYFREYRMANETNERAPLLLVHLLFADSVTPYVAGAQVKNFLSSGRETPVSGEQQWDIGDESIEVHSVKVVETDQGGMLAVMYFDTDPAPLDSKEEVARRGLPVAREAHARGLLDSARAVMKGRGVTNDIGVGFIRNDPEQGHLQIKIGFPPEEYLK